MKKFGWLRVFSVVVLSLFIADAIQAGTPPHVVNTYPTSGAKNVKTVTKIGITFSDQVDKSSVTLTNITVVGSKAGAYPGSVSTSTNGRTIIFQSSHQFLPDEKVTATISNIKFISTTDQLSYVINFQTSLSTAVIDTNYHSDDPILERSLHGKRRTKKLVSQNLSPLENPDDLPTLNVITNSQPMKGLLYLANYKFYVDTEEGTYMLVLNANGTLDTAIGNGSDYFNDFKPHPNGTYSYFDVLKAKYFIMDTSFTIIDSVEATNGFITDGHDFVVTPENNYIIIAIDYEYMDLRHTVVDGDSNAAVLIPVIQVFDKEKNLIMEWRSIDHFKLIDATHEDLSANVIDFCHVNAIDLDSGNTFLLSSRHMDEITKIDLESGNIIWRMGGINNQFTFTNDTIPFSHQHAIRRIANGNYTLFDNGNIRFYDQPYSRALEYKLDEVNHRATKVWEFRHTPDVFGSAMGYVQRLDNGNTLIGWGACDKLSVTEVDKNFKTRFELAMDTGNYSYRAYKYDPNYLLGLPSAVRNQSGNAVANICAYPNPVSTTTSITVEIPVDRFITVELRNTFGTKVAEVFSGQLLKGVHSLQLDCTNLPRGVYFLKFLGVNTKLSAYNIIVSQ
ncbi:MAG: aryl-sulfate sulfotransferase [bacterium]